MRGLVLGLLVLLVSFYLARTFVAVLLFSEADLSVYYLTGSRVTQGLNPYPWQNFPDAVQLQILGQVPFLDYIFSVPDRGLLYPPLAAVLFAPLSRLEYGQAKIIWAALNDILIAVVIALTIRILGVKARSVEGGVIALIYLLNPAFDHTVRLGQITLFQFALLLLYHGSLKVGRKALAGWLLGLALVLRPTLVALFPLFLLWKREYKAFFWTALAGGLLFLAPLPLLGLEAYQSFLSKMASQDVWGVLPARSNLSLAGFFYSLAFPDKLMSSVHGGQSEGPSYDPFAQLSFYLMAVGVLAITAFFTRPGRPGSPADRFKAEWEFSLVLLATLLISPLTWYHYYVLASFPFSVATIYLLRKQGRRWLSWVALGAMYSFMVGEWGLRILMESVLLISRRI